MTDIFDVLADPGRRDVMRVLLEARNSASTGSDSSELSVSELVARTGVSQPSVSKQLKALRDAGLVGVREEGQHRLYHLNEQPLVEVLAWLSDFAPLERTAPRSRRESVSCGDDAHMANDAVAEIATAVGRTAATVSHQVGTVLDVATATLVEGIERFTAFARSQGQRDGRDASVD